MTDEQKKQRIIAVAEELKAYETSISPKSANLTPEDFAGLLLLAADQAVPVEAVENYPPGVVYGSPQTIRELEATIASLRQQLDEANATILDYEEEEEEMNW